MPIKGKDIIAERLIVSSSVVHYTQSFSSGSTKFGDDMSDEHAFTGSFFVTASEYNLMGGNVGIGTTSPGQKLTIQGGNIEITGSGGTGIFFTGTADNSNKNALYFRTQGGTEKFRFIHDAAADNTTPP